MKTESRMVVGRDWGEEGKGELWFNEYSLFLGFFLRDEKSSGDLLHNNVNVDFKMVNMLHFMYILPQFKKITLKKKVKASSQA